MLFVTFKAFRFESKRLKKTVKKKKQKDKMPQELEIESDDSSERSCQLIENREENEVNF